MSAGWAEWIIRLSLCAVPRSHRDERREQWLADLAGCAELDMPMRRVVIGAVATAVTFRHAPRFTEPTTKGTVRMDESLKGVARLVLYAVWVLGSVISVWIMGTHLAVSGSNVGFHMPGGPTVDMIAVMLVASSVSAVVGAALGYRSLRLSFGDGAPDRR